MPALLLALVLGGFNTYTVQLVSCYDGDTCDFNFVFPVSAEPGLSLKIETTVTAVAQTVRFCDVNAPEIRPLDTREAGTRSRDALVAWLKAAKVITIQIPQEKTCPKPGYCDAKEKYGRWLGYVLADGVNLNQKLIADGLAVSFMSCQ